MQPTWKAPATAAALLFNHSLKPQQHPHPLPASLPLTPISHTKQHFSIQIQQKSFFPKPPRSWRPKGTPWGQHHLTWAALPASLERENPTAGLRHRPRLGFMFVIILISHLKWIQGGGRDKLVPFFWEE